MKSFNIKKSDINLSLVASVLLLSSSVYLNANVISINDTNSSTQNINGKTTSLNITSSGKVIVSDKYAAIYVENGLDNQYIKNEGVAKSSDTDGGVVTIYVGNDMINGAYIENTKTIEAINNDVAVGIDIFGKLKEGSQIINSGTISSNSNNNDGIGIQVSSMDSSSIENSGTINSSGDGGVGSGIKISNGMNSSSIENSGTINSSGDDYGDGIQVFENMNSSSIKNSGTINSSHNDGYGIWIATNIKSSSMENSGTINGFCGIVTSNMDSSSIKNSGIINSNYTDNEYETYGIYARNIKSSSIENSGTINSNEFGLSVNSLDSTSKIINSGTIETLNGYSIRVSNNNGTITNESAGILKGNIKVLDGNGEFINKGFIILPAKVNGKDSAQIKKFTQTSTGKLQITLDTASDGVVANKYSQLKTDKATFESGATIDVNVKTASENKALLKGKKLDDVVSATNSLTINGSLNITDNSALLDFKYEKDGNTIDLNIVEASSVDDSTKSGGGTKSAQNVAKAVETKKEIVTKLNTLPTNESVAQTVESFTPTIAVSNLLTAINLNNVVMSVIEDRQNSMLGMTGLNSGDNLFKEKKIWFKPYISKGSQKSTKDLTGFDLKTKGFGIGIDGEYKTNYKAGFALFYTKAKADTNKLLQHADIDVFNFVIYGSNTMIDSRTNLLYKLSYGRQKSDTSRVIFNKDIAKAKYTVKTLSLDLQLKRDYKISDRLSLLPSIGLRYIHINSPAYKESGAKNYNLSTEKFNADDFLATIGALAHYKISNNFNLKAGLNLGYYLNKRNYDIQSSIGGSKFITKGANSDRFKYDISIGMGAKALGGDLSLSYNYQKESKFKNNSLSLKYSYKF